ncbi:peptide/nickel transport system substrate-binding protein [Enhydrobacter aerosaccus]|uniref:Peptide/nickel transport system substrate-binding protein n=1 Tax=Enhydrobacter aerosaccus TaxID=225324 RepID=A0A1T4ND55_9HYPH|nr:ABC transporter substrate-binding protein [Enhydrobacter aerosaccus]SJZ76927.1 peptide/nickel transport system substrate-binding protein [Enhydrobacter aerosaccus]
MTLSRRSLLAGTAALTLPVPTVLRPALADGEKLVRYGIAMADVPLTTGQPDRGAGAYQFTGLTIYDPLIAWELDVSDRPGKMIPGLATDWKVGDADRTIWTIRLRSGVKFHDGSAFDADAVIWNLEKIFNKDAPQFDTRQAAQVRPRLPGLASYRKAGDMEIEIKTKTVDSLFPYQLLWFLVSSPAQWEKVGRDWNKFASEPSGTGPFKLARLVPRERVELVRNDGYWDPKRVAKADRMILLCTPEDSSRSAALISGTVDLIEAPAPDVLDRLKQSGARIVSNITPHVFQYHPSLLPGSPWADIRVRKAANLAIDRDAIVKLLNGLVKPAYGEVDRTSPWFGKPTFEIKYAPDAARQLMTEAGFGKANRMKAKISIQAGGTNQMVNEAIQEMLKEAFIDIEFRVLDLEALMTGWRSGARADMNAGISATNVTHVTSDPFYAVIRFFASDQVAPVGVNWSSYKNAEVDKLATELRNTFDPAKQDELAGRIHALAVDDAAMIWVYHDAMAHALSPRIKSYVQAQSWYQDIGLIGV